MYNYRLSTANGKTIGVISLENEELPKLIMDGKKMLLCGSYVKASHKFIEFFISPEPATPETVDVERLYATTQADVWAKEFAKVVPEVDEGLMVGWFANAIETAKDHERRRIEEAKNQLIENPCCICSDKPAVCHILDVFGELLPICEEHRAVVIARGNGDWIREFVK